MALFGLLDDPGQSSANPNALYNGLLSDPDTQRAMANRGLMAMAGAFGQAAMPSRMPIPIGAALGNAAAAYGNAQDQTIKTRTEAAQGQLYGAQSQLAGAQSQVALQTVALLKGIGVPGSQIQKLLDSFYGPGAGAAAMGGGGAGGGGAGGTSGGAPAVASNAGGTLDLLNGEHGDKIKAAADAAGVDRNLFAAVINTESGGNPNLVNPETGASGFGQLLPSTAQGLGVKNILDPDENLNASARYLKQQLDLAKGDPQLALKYYYGGPDTSKWGPKTDAYPGLVMSRVPPTQTASAATTATDAVPDTAVRPATAATPAAAPRGLIDDSSPEAQAYRQKQIVEALGGPTAGPPPAAAPPPVGGPTNLPGPPTPLVTPPGPIATPPNANKNFSTPAAVPDTTANEVGGPTPGTNVQGMTPPAPIRVAQAGPPASLVPPPAPSPAVPPIAAPAAPAPASGRLVAPTPPAAPLTPEQIRAGTTLQLIGGLTNHPELGTMVTNSPQWKAAQDAIAARYKPFDLRPGVAGGFPGQPMVTNPTITEFYDPGSGRKFKAPWAPGDPSPPPPGTPGSNSTWSEPSPQEKRAGETRGEYATGVPGEPTGPPGSVQGGVEPDKPQPSPLNGTRPYQSTIPPVSQQAHTPELHSYGQAMPEWIKTSNDISSTGASAQSAEQNLMMIANAFKMTQTGTWATQKAEFNGILKAINPTWSVESFGNLAAVQTALHANYRETLQSLAAANKRFTGNEFKVTSDAGQSAGNQPEANLNMMAQDLGQLHQLQAFAGDWNAAQTQVASNGQHWVNPDSFRTAWMTHNQLSGFIDNARQQIGPLKGMTGATPPPAGGAGGGPVLPPGIPAGSQPGPSVGGRPTWIVPDGRHVFEPRTGAQ